MDNYSSFPLSPNFQQRKHITDPLLLEKKLETINKIASKNINIHIIHEENQKLKEIENKIVLLKNSSDSEVDIKKLNSTKKQIIKVINSLYDLLPTAEEEEPAVIFEIEYQIRKALEGELENKEKIQKVYDTIIIPLVAQAKKGITERIGHYSSQAAALKGKAAAAGISAIKNLTESQTIISDSEESSGEVFVLPKEKVVFKHSNPKAEEQENTVNALFDLISKQAVVGSFKIKTTSRKKFGIQTVDELCLRGHKFDYTNLKLMSAIRKTLSPENGQLVDNYFKALKSAKSNPTKDVGELFLTPDLSNEDVKNAYEICEKFLWQYVDKNGERQECNFKNLQENFLLGVPMTKPTPISKVDIRFPTSEQFTKGLKVNWIAYYPELMKANQYGEVSRVTDTYAKPFIKGMELLQYLTWDEREGILQRLTPESQFNAILTGEFQLLDYHATNIGFVPKFHEGFERFKELKFTVANDHNSPLSYNQLIKKYLTGEISNKTSLEFVENGKTITSVLENLPELLKSLNVQWELVIFDTDGALYENNTLKFLNTIIYFSALLTTDWKDTPLSKETVIRLTNSQQQDQLIQNWIKKTDSPIYKRLSKQAISEIQPLINSCTSKYNFTNSDDKKTPTIKSLQSKFVNEFTKDPLTFKIWEIVEEDLSHVTVGRNDTWETIAGRHHQNIDELRLLNQKELKPGEKIKIKCDLTSSLSNEVLMKRKKIAAQFFPRLTHLQQTALIDRQNHRNSYLKNFQKLSESKFERKQLLGEIENFLSSDAVPLTSIRKEELLNKIIEYRKGYNDNPLMIDELYQSLCKECQPTYFNLMAVMYPLLADAHALHKALNSERELFFKKNAGSPWLVFSNYSLNEIIEDAEKKCLPNSPELKLARNLRKKIAEFELYTS